MNIRTWIVMGAINKDGIRRKLVMWMAKSEVDKIMDGKSVWKSKTVWAAIVGVALGAVQPISTALGHPIQVPNWVYEVLGSIGLYGLRDGQGKPLQ